MTERWVTAAAVIAARDRLEQALGGWQRPAAYAIATGSPEEVVFWRVNVGDHPLPAVVLATATGYRGRPSLVSAERCGIGRGHRDVGAG